jgi:Rps23 Pro-64 3,4-dihydroxylase Tpa1-like proline 4-hydroxylase
MNKNEYNSHILVKDNVLPIKFCNSIIERFENDPRKELTTTKIHKFLTKSKTGKTFGIIVDLNDEKWIDLLKSFADSVNDNIQEYCKKINFKKPPLSNIILPYINVQKILDGGFYEPHIDVDSQDHKRVRIITCIWYLNDVEKGGETHFLKTGLKIKPKTGRLLLFPSDRPFVHEGLPPIGTKYIVSGWLETEKLINSFYF